MAKTLKTVFRKTLDAQIRPPEGMEEMIGSETSVTVQQAIVYSIIQKAMSGDLKAAEFIRDLTDGKKNDPAKKPPSAAERCVTVRVIE